MWLVTGTGAGPDRGESLAYCAVAEHFRKARRDRSAKDALNKVVLSTTNVLARTAYPDIELEKGWGSYIMYGLFSIVAVAAGAFAVFGLLGTVVTMMLESAAVVTLTGTLASAAISGVAIHVMDVLTRNHVEYQKCLEVGRCCSEHVPSHSCVRARANVLRHVYAGSPVHRCLHRWSVVPVCVCVFVRLLSVFIHTRDQRVTTTFASATNFPLDPGKTAES